MKFYESGEYRATKNWPYSICAGCAVYRLRGKTIEVLLLFRKAGAFPRLKDGDIDTYHLPKGHMRIGETLEQTALRETEEEAGCEIKLQTYLGANLNQYTDIGIKRDKIIHYFAGEWQKDKLEMDNEHSDRLWLPIEEAVQKIGSANPKREDKILERLQQFLCVISMQQS